MDEETKDSTTLQLCSIRIAFPVHSDDEAIEYKKKVGDVLAGLSAVRMSFDLTSVPQQKGMPPNGNL